MKKPPVISIDTTGEKRHRVEENSVINVARKGKRAKDD
jgi:hypothetical protein